ncbi:hypothetical protein D779_3457 [Imhoffiella purpurea]|uniref:Uncharacterized protein n=1 Tax=Imhoffiella purpurea TaxID=1249627 RepID=W9VCD4_9GAMM|nr:hypothetical protein D779_3457 [Imhoffiella purpurea]
MSACRESAGPGRVRCAPRLGCQWSSPMAATTRAKPSA